MLSEWLPFRDLYISEILGQEQPPTDSLCPKCKSEEGLLQCKDCFSRDLLCENCCLTVHRNSPFHSVEKWTGRFFQPTLLNEDRFTLHLGHGGTPCPKAQASAESGDVPTENARRCLTVVDVSGVRQLYFEWCQCDGAPEAGVQLLRSQLFPASVSKPSTAFTFRVLDYFRIDSVECKTSALSFFSKLRRLTNNSSPDSVPVSSNILPFDGII